MQQRKQQLLRRHRQRKRVALLLGLPLLFSSALWFWWLPLPLLLAAWVLHEAYFADHLFYAPGDDYDYRFAGAGVSVSITADGRLGLAQLEGIAEADTLLLEVTIKADWRGRWLDPRVLIDLAEPHDQQTFERGCAGRRVVNLSGLGLRWRQGRCDCVGVIAALPGKPRCTCYVTRITPANAC